MLDLFARPPLAPADLPAPKAFEAFQPFLKGVFSQWHATAFTLEGRRFVTAEQWMMFAKATLFGMTPEPRPSSPRHPAAQKRHGQRVEGFDQDRWDRWKVGIVHAGNLAKFGQNLGARRQLAATAPAMLVEANPRDWIWGAGLAADDPRVQNPTEWKGQNLLGRILTQVRAELG